MWIKEEIESPKVEKTDFGFASRYVLVRLSDGGICNARLEGNTEDNLFWYSPMSGDQIDDVIEWVEIPE